MADEPNDEIDIEALQDQLASFSVEQFLISAASTIASLAYAKLERGDLVEARKAIALTRLQLAYADAVNP